MKKMVSFISALAMCAVMAAPMASSAAEGDDLQTETTSQLSTKNLITEAGSSDVTITKEIKSSYRVVIPVGTADIDKGETTLTVSAENVIIDDGQTLDISVKSENGWNLVDQNSSSNTLAYTLTPAGETVISVAGSKLPVSVLSVEAGDTDGDSKTMTAAVTGTPTKSGSYADTLTFEVKLNTPEGGDAT